MKKPRNKKKPKPASKKQKPRKTASKKQKPASKKHKPASKKQKPASKKQKQKPRKKRRKKRPTKTAFERRREIRADGSPPGFDIIPGAATQDEAYATIKARLDDAQAALPEGYKARIIIHPYADGSVDGELYVVIPEGDKTGDVEWDFYESFGALTVGQRYWISIGARYIIEGDDEIYRRYRGMNQVQTNYQRATQPNIVEEHLIARNKLLPGMKKHYKREAHSLFIRLHWNPANEQPKR